MKRGAKSVACNETRSDISLSDMQLEYGNGLLEEGEELEESDNSIHSKVGENDANENSEGPAVELET